MSKEFIQFTFPCSECLVLAACKEKPTTMKDFVDNINPRCIAMPIFDIHNKKESYSKTFLECWANVGWEAVQRLKREDKDKIPIQIIDFLIVMNGILQWIVNSSSWKDGEELYEFDLSEIKQKLKMAEAWLR